MIDETITVQKITKLNEKNAKNEYSLGDVLLLDNYEKKLMAAGWTRKQVKELSPNYYR
jgi:hypothetical protein